MENHRITFTYLNIRQSIAILLAKLILTDIVMALIIGGFYWVLVLSYSYRSTTFTGVYSFLAIFGFIGVIKIALSIYTVLQWLNEYYEITPDYIYHKKGIIFRKTEEYRISQIRRVDIQNTFLGELFGFATLSLFDSRINKFLDLYLIHNPKRYASVLKEIQPEIEIVRNQIRLPYIPEIIL